MNTKNQNPGKKLSRGEMKNLKGGSVLGKFCTVPSDCAGVCTNDSLYGYWCFSGRCRYTICP
jgi:natural product precursor